MKKIVSILGAVCFVIGFAMATGIDKNPIQAVYTLMAMVAALLCFRVADKVEGKNEGAKRELNPLKLEKAA